MASRQATPLVLLLLLAGAGLALSGLSCGEPCAASLESYCASLPNGCPMTWAAAHVAKSWGCPGTVELMSCDNVDVATMPGIDTGTTYYYDPTSGALERIEAYSANFGGSHECLAGSGSLPSCTATVGMTITCGP